MNTLKNICALILIVSLPAAALFSIVELWTEWETAYKLKWTFATLAAASLIMGLTAQSAEKAADKES